MTAEEIEAIVGGYHGDPFRILGPHAVRKRRGQACWEVRAFLPQAESPTLLIGETIRSHGEGARRRLLSARRSDRRCRCAYRLQRATLGRRRHRSSKTPTASLRIITDFDLHLHGEGTHYESYRTLGAHLVDVRRRGRRALRGLGAERRERVAWSAISTTGTRAAIPCACATAASGRSSFPALGEGDCLQVSSCARASRLPAAEGRSLRLPQRSAAEIGVGRLATSTATSGTTPNGWSARAERDWLKEPVSIYEVHLESWMRGPAGRVADLSRAGRQPGRVREAHGLHAHRADAHHGASVLRLLGLPGHRLLRAHLALRHARRFHVLRRSLPSGRHRRDHGLGARAFPQGRARPGVLRRHRALRARRSAPGRASRLGHADLQLRPQRGARRS